jgi:opacity protein-like surface antigen
MSARCFVLSFSLLLAYSSGNASTALAQVPTVPAGQSQKTSMVRTTRDKVLVWRRNPSMVLATLPEGTLLEALAREGQWYEVRVPEKFAGAGGATGFVYQGHVELVEGAPPPSRPVRPPPGRTSPGARRAAPPPPAFAARGYGIFAVDWFQASDSFKAILDTSSGFFYGGGGQAIFRHLFLDVSLEHFEKTGERAIVVDGEVFRLGIPDTITMNPIRVTGGYRFPARNGTVPYVGGGIGSVRFQETSDFADADETTDERFTSYHALAGVEYAARKWLFVAAEIRYTSVPDALGAPGIADEFDESNLGGVGVAVKVMVGK